MIGSVRVIADSGMSLGRSLPLVIGHELARRLGRPVRRQVLDDGQGVACADDVVVVDGWRTYRAAVRCLGRPSLSIVAVLAGNEDARMLVARPICRVVTAGSALSQPSSASSVGRHVGLSLPTDPFPSSRRTRTGPDRRWGVIGAVTPPDNCRWRRIPPDTTFDEKVGLARWADVLVMEHDHRDNPAVAVHAVASGAVVLTGRRLGTEILEGSPAVATIDDWSGVMAGLHALDPDAGRRRLERLLRKSVGEACDLLVAGMAPSLEAVS